MLPAVSDAIGELGADEQIDGGGSGEEGQHPAKARVAKVHGREDRGQFAAILPLEPPDAEGNQGQASEEDHRQQHELENAEVGGGGPTPQETGKQEEPEDSGGCHENDASQAEPVACQIDDWGQVLF